MREYVIWLCGWQDHGLDKSRWPEVMHPNSVPWRLVSAGDDYRVDVQGVEVSFSDMRLLGVRVAFHGTRVPTGLACQVLEEILANIQRVIGREGMALETCLH